MAKIAKETFAIQLSKLVKDNESEELKVLTEQDIKDIETVIEEMLAEKNVVVEVLTV